MHACHARVHACSSPCILLHAPLLGGASAFAELSSSYVCMPDTYSTHDRDKEQTNKKTTFNSLLLMPWG